MRAIHRRPSKALAGLPLDERLGSITDLSFLRQALQGVDGVIHCAVKISITGDKDGEVARTNVQGTTCVLDLCHQLQIPKLVHIASVHAFDLVKIKQLSIQSPLAPGDAFAYDASKRDAYLKVQQAAKDGLNAVILCPVALLGPHDYRLSLMGKFFVGLYKGRLPALVKGAFYWADVRDTAAAAINALRHGKRGTTYLLSGHHVSVGELARIAAQVCNKRLRRPQLPYFLALLGLPFLRGWAYLTKSPPLYTYESLRVLRHHPEAIDDTPARRELGYALRPLHDTIKDTYDWLRQQDQI